MEFKFNMTNLMRLPPTPSPPCSPRRARIFPDSTPICSPTQPIGCYDPDSLRKAFHPLGTFSKLFGLFPCYDFSFVEHLAPKSVRIIHVLDYMYSGLIFCLLTFGAILCTIYKPGIIQSASESDKNLDYYVKIGLIYATIFAGVQSLFVFPMKWNGVLTFVQLITNIDKILRFDGRLEERGFAKKVLFYLIGCLIFTLSSFLFLFVYEGQTYKKSHGYPNPTPCSTDFLMAPIMTLAMMALVIPTGLSIFFLNAMRLRMEHFNRKMAVLLKPFVTSCYTCNSFQDYGREVDEYIKTSESQQEKVEKNLAEDLEKMRILYCEIRTLGNCMNCIFGLHLVRDFLYSLVALVLYTYFLIHFRNEGQYIWAIYAGHSIFIVLKMVVIVCFAQLICCQAIVLEGTLQRVSLRRLPQDCSLQIQTFLTALINPPTISASGFFSVNKALMTSIVASITTYFIILIQFKFTGLFSEMNSSNHTSTTAPQATFTK